MAAMLGYGEAYSQATRLQSTRPVIVQQATGQIPRQNPPAKHPAAVALGRLGELRGGKARAAKLSASRRKQIAHRAAKVRWGS